MSLITNIIKLIINLDDVKLTNKDINLLTEFYNLINDYISDLLAELIFLHNYNAELFITSLFEQLTKYKIIKKENNYDKTLIYNYIKYYDIIKSILDLDTYIKADNNIETINIAYSTWNQCNENDFFNIIKSEEHNNFLVVLKSSNKIDKYIANIFFSLLIQVFYNDPCHINKIKEINILSYKFHK